MTNEIFFSTDIETTGTRAGLNSILSVGISAYKPGNEEPIGTMYINIKRQPDTEWDDDCLRWWREQSTEAWEALWVDRETPEYATRRIDRFVTATLARTRNFADHGNKEVVPIFVASPAVFDHSFIKWLFDNHSDPHVKNPFRDVLCLHNLASFLLKKPLYECSQSQWPERWKVPNKMPHHALHDATTQGTAMIRMLKEARHETKLDTQSIP